MLQKNALVMRKTYYSGRSFPQNQCIKRKIVNISNFFKKSVFFVPNDSFSEAPPLRN